MKLSTARYQPINSLRKFRDKKRNPVTKNSVTKKNTGGERGGVEKNRKTKREKKEIEVKEGAFGGVFCVCVCVVFLGDFSLFFRCFFFVFPCRSGCFPAAPVNYRAPTCNTQSLALPKPPPPFSISRSQRLSRANSRAGK